ncbi:MAG: efflux transporter periplasmic adaptor subunit [Mucilaginibacter sp.]|nr:efflux transporter periplasmic adaptor subunit [Mucilaginibacter sp.]
MNNKHNRYSCYGRAGVYFLLAFLIAALFEACKQKIQPKMEQKMSKTQSRFYYTCSMHPQIHEDHPGNCPICGMKLIKVEMTGDDAASMNKIVLTAAQVQLAGIQTDIVREESVANEKVLTGTVTANENRSEQLSARIGGRIQQLFIRTLGEKVAVGQPVYAIYSEDLLEAEKEYLLARQQQKVLNNPDVDYKRLISAAENKLILWGLTPVQIKNLATSAKVLTTVTMHSNVSGTVSDIAVHEGDYVTEGAPILKTQGLNSLWVEAQLYAGEAGSYHENDQVSVSFPDLSNQLISGKVEFINPELSDASKVDLVRISITNLQGLIRPGMQAYISVGSRKNKTLAVPASSVLSDGKGDMVWVKNADGSFTSKTIKLGVGNQSYLPVLSGLNKGDIVVTNGAYLLNSEALFKNGNNDSMSRMKM